MAPPEPLPPALPGPPSAPMAWLPVNVQWLTLSVAGPAPITVSPMVLIAAPPRALPALPPAPPRPPMAWLPLKEQWAREMAVLGPPLVAVNRPPPLPSPPLPPVPPTPPIAWLSVKLLYSTVAREEF